MMAHRVAIAMQGGGAHGAFTWGVLDRLLDEVRDARLEISALSGSSAGAINGALVARGLSGMPTQREAARGTQALLESFWTALSERAFYSGNPLLGGLYPGLLSGWNLDWNPAVIALEMASLVVSPYDAPFYSNPLAPLVSDFLPRDMLLEINSDPRLRLYVCATNVATGQRRVFTQPHISLDSLLASACLPSHFRAIQIDATPYWDGAYIGNPALAPLVHDADDIVIITVNPISTSTAAPRSARQILDRLNDINGNAPLVLEMNAIHAVNKLLHRMPPDEVAQTGFRPIRLHLIRNDQLMAPLGFAGKDNASAEFLRWLFEGGRATAKRWLRTGYAHLGQHSSCDWKDGLDLEHDVIDPNLKGG